MIPGKNDTISEIKPFHKTISDAKDKYAQSKAYSPKVLLKEICEDCGIDWTGGIECGS